MLSVAIIGCGKIADAHVAQIQRIRGCRIAGVCDSEPLMAKQLAERFGISGHYGDLDELLNDARPDVVHITTPPESHFSIARRCLESGSHVYVEKPFTINENEAQRLFRLANQKQLKVTVGHDYQFTLATRRMRMFIERGFLGDRPLHMESYNSFEFGPSGYSSALLKDSRYWERQLPGKLLQNNISHGIARIAEFLEGESPTVQACGFTGPFLKGLGEKEIIDELRVIIVDEGQTTAYFTFSTYFRPALHQFRIFGSNNGLMVDQFQETVVKLRGGRYKLYAEHVIPPFAMARQHAANGFRNARALLDRSLYMKNGMKELIERFYSAITEDQPVPISQREILLTTRIMDSIFSQLSRHAADRDERQEVLAGRRN